MALGFEFVSDSGELRLFAARLGFGRVEFHSNVIKVDQQARRLDRSSSRLLGLADSMLGSMRGFAGRLEQAEDEAELP